MKKEAGTVESEKQEKVEREGNKAEEKKKELYVEPVLLNFGQVEKYTGYPFMGKD
jgi:hypothetical protein